MKIIMSIVIVLALISIHVSLIYAEQPSSSTIGTVGESLDAIGPPIDPSENSMNFSLGRYIRKQNTLNLQPLTPFSIRSDSSLPMGAINLLKNERWGVERSGAVVYTLRAWVGGVQINNIWSFAGEGQDTGRVLIQPFLNYNLSQGWYLTGSSLISSNFSLGGGNMWTAPVGGGFGKVISVYGQVLNLGAQGYIYPIRQDHVRGRDWTIQATLQWLFPK